jgi:hypothetical protein
MADFNWTCPHCERAVTISDERTTEDRHPLWMDNAGGRLSLITRFIVCPNPECRLYTLTATLHDSWPNRGGGGEMIGGVREAWESGRSKTLKPRDAEQPRPNVSAIPGVSPLAESLGRHPALYGRDGLRVHRLPHEARLHREHDSQQTSRPLNPRQIHAQAGRRSRQTTPHRESRLALRGAT